MPSESDSVQHQKGASGSSGSSGIPTFGAHSLQHKAEVAPIFLGYNRVNADGQCIPLVQVVAAIIQSMGNPDLLDAVQPMKNGWYIYMTTNADRTRLVGLGLNVAGKHIELCSDTRAGKSAVKVTLKDLLLHSISNKDVLDALKQHCTVASEVKYSNLWHDGRLTGVHTGDRFVYVSSTEVSKLPNLLDVLTYKARVIKPPHMSQCKCCGQLGHCLSDLSCPAQAVEGVVETVETFCGGKCQLSNLHQCPEGCVISDRGTTFATNEHHYQFKKLKAHDTGEEAYLLLTKESGFDAMKKAKSLLPDDKLSSDWKDCAYAEMQE